MILGDQKTNPYTIANMTLAYNTLYNQSISSLNPTHQYIKFEPNDPDHLGNLDDWERDNLIPIFDFPLDYEITKPGDAYYDPAVTNFEYTYRYASVPVGMALPNVPHVVLSDLFIPPYSSYLTEQAFYQVNEPFDGNTDRVQNEGDGSPPTDNDPPVDPCNPGCDDFPCCKLPWYECDTKPCTPILPPDCYPGSPDWPYCLDLDPPVGPPTVPPPPNDPPNPPDEEFCECSEYEQGQLVYTYVVKLNPGESCEDLEVSSGGLDIRCGGYTPPNGGGNGGGGGNPPNLNECDCPIPNNPRIPAGCVQVDNDGSWKQVSQVMVKTRDNWFSGDITFTNAQGCWNVNKIYSKRWTWVWVEFQNPNAKIRAVRGNNFHKALVVADDYVDLFKNQPFNNFLIRYDEGSSNVDGLARMYWACAHMINADFEYRASASGMGIPLPRSGMNYLLRSGGFLAGAPMMQGKPLIGLVNLSSVNALVVTNIFLGGTTGPLVPLSVAFSSKLLPDIVRGYTAGGSANGFRVVNMHELGHASHYSIVGENYWVPYRTHIVSNSQAGNGVYGSFGNFSANSDPGRVTLGEAIGSYTENIIGRGNPIDFDTWVDSYIPTGLMYDLQDGVSNSDVIIDPNDGSSTSDVISGFTPAMIFGSLNQSTVSIRSFRDRLRTLSLSSTPNTVATYNSFVNVYDVFN